MLEIKNLKKYFGGIKAVDGCSFKLSDNKITALIGPNGAGKSTVFNLISGFEKKDKGKIFLSSQDITELKPYQISKLGLSRVFQKSRLFNNLTVKENLLISINKDNTQFWNNLLYPNKNKKLFEEKITDVLKLLNITKMKNHIAGDLSFGQKRLVELARAIILPHKILILDEPVAGVNPKIRKDIMKILSILKKQGETILLIEHDMYFTLNISDHIIVMDEGKVIAEGTPAQIKKNKKVLEAYLGD